MIENLPDSRPGFEPLIFRRLSLEEQLANSRKFLARMQQRRSVREFSSQPVPFELIENAIATANSAPSGANQQPWSFAVISNPALKQTIRLAAERVEKENYERRMSDDWREAVRPLGTDWNKPLLENAPYLIVVFEQPYGIYYNELGEEIKYKHYYALESTGIAVGMLIAHLQQAGLAALIHTPSPMGFLCEILNRPKNERPFAIIPVGYPAENCVVPTLPKKPLSKVLFQYE